MRIRSSLTSLAGDTAWVVEFAKFVTEAYDRAVLTGDSFELRALIREITRHLRGQAVPPERTLAAVKALLPVGPRATDTFRISEARRLRDDVSHWCIVEYFASEDVPHP